MTKRIISGEEVVAWVCTQAGVNREYFGPCAAIGLEQDDELRAGVVFNRATRKNIVTHIVTDNSKQWASRAFLRAICSYPFEYLGKTRATAYVEEANTESQHFLERFGFELEFRMKDAGNTGDLLVYRIFKQDCRWL